MENNNQIDGINYIQGDNGFTLDNVEFSGTFIDLYNEYKKQNPSQKLIPWLMDKGLQKEIRLQQCPCCNSTNTRQDYDFENINDCKDCGADYLNDGEIILDPRNIK